ncbi:MAG: COQ9 family protein, partial [Rhodospirillales bacterium]|nr:COQ9 family protein [Rhodospirillales bacterium]
MRAMELEEKRDELLLAALAHVPFEGWSNKALRLAAADLAWDATMPERLFPGGAADAVEHYSDYADRRMVVELAEHDLTNLRVPQRIALGIRLRLERCAPDRESVRRAVTLLALPNNSARALCCTYRSVDQLWRAVGDT